MAGDQAEPAKADSALALISAISFEMNSARANHFVAIFGSTLPPFSVSAFAIA